MPSRLCLLKEDKNKQLYSIKRLRTSVGEVERVKGAGFVKRVTRIQWEVAAFNEIGAVGTFLDGYRRLRLVAVFLPSREKEVVSAVVQRPADSEGK